MAARLPGTKRRPMTAGGGLSRPAAAAPAAPLPPSRLLSGGLAAGDRPRSPRRPAASSIGFAGGDRAAAGRRGGGGLL